MSTPHALPGIRDSLIRTWRPGGLARLFHDRLVTMPPEEMPAVGEFPTPEHQLWALSESTLWLVRRDAVDMIAQSAPSLPIESSLPDDLRRQVPGDAALIVFEGGIECAAWDPDSHISAAPLDVMLVAFATYVTANGEEVEAATITWYAPMSHTLGPDHPAANELMVVVSSTWDLGTPLGVQSTFHREHYGELPAPDPSDVEDRRLLLSTLALASQDRVMESSFHLDRASRRRAERAGRDADLDAVRVSDLRSATKASRSTASEQAGRYRHRWVVDGHWRSQPYGPQSSLRRPVWIAPHLKGPDGAPLLAGEKVKVLR